MGGTRARAGGRGLPVPVGLRSRGGQGRPGPRLGRRRGRTEPPHAHRPRRRTRRRQARRLAVGEAPMGARGRRYPAVGHHADHQHHRRACPRTQGRAASHGGRRLQSPLRGRGHDQGCHRPGSSRRSSSSWLLPIISVCARHHQGNLTRPGDLQADPGTRARARVHDLQAADDDRGRRGAAAGGHGTRTKSTAGSSRSGPIRGSLRPGAGFGGCLSTSSPNCGTS